MSGQETYPERGTAETIKLGLRGRCPRCSRGDLFTKYLKVAPACAVCGLSLEWHDTGDGPVVPAILVIGGLVVAVAMYVELAYEPPLWLHAALWLPLVTGLTMVALPLLKGMSIALQFKFRSTEDPPQADLF